MLARSHTYHGGARAGRGQSVPALVGAHGEVLDGSARLLGDVGVGGEGFQRTHEHLAHVTDGDGGAAAGAMGWGRRGRKAGRIETTRQ